MPDGSIHSIQVGLQMVEEFRLRCKESVEEDPLEKVAVVYEGELTKIKSQLPIESTRLDEEDDMFEEQGQVLLFVRFVS